MRRLLPLLALPLFAVAAPVPKEKPDAKLKRLFGEVADAPKGYAFTLDGDQLLVTMAAGASKSIEEDHARTEREVTGDFEMRVVLTFAPPKVKLNDAGTDPHLIAGLGVWGTGSRFAMHGPFYGSAGVEKNADGWGYGEMSYVKYEDDRAWSSWCLHREFRKYERRHLLLRRESGKHWYGESADGKEWELWAGEPVELPAAVRVGVFVLNTSAAECSATFSDFAVTPLKPAK